MLTGVFPQLPRKRVSSTREFAREVSCGFNVHARRKRNLMETIFPRGFNVHVRLLHVVRFLLFHPRKPLAFSAYNLIVSISNQLLFFLNIQMKPNEKCCKNTSITLHVNLNENTEMMETYLHCRQPNTSCYLAT